MNKSLVRSLTLLACLLIVERTLPAQKAANAPSKPALAQAILGTWSTIVPVTQNGAGPKFTVTFMPNGTLQQLIEGKGHRIRLRASYRLKNDLITEKGIDATEDGKKIPIPRSEPQTMKVRIQGNKLILALTNGTSTMVFSRVK